MPPPLDLTAYLFGMPEGEWLGFDMSVPFGHPGIGLTSTVPFDARGQIGTLGQVLAVRPQPQQAGISRPACPS
ncbi:TPA: thioesterase family protein [Stenotrophomonas maltophilia]|uniref:thioesterase family protein n=1 Tax=Stenotrophomonas maltophilia TaxID=40324 RepID=UPI000DB1403A|nr:thioesterase family protein [Stenotrophomonas maltophilia]PZS68513.1 hypothetical protein A7X68_08615 [Stenotrophomonas maltophilia]